MKLLAAQGRRRFRWLGLGAALWLAAAGWAVPQWRIFRAADGLSESHSTAITISPRGNVWVNHGEAHALSVLDGYTIKRIPAPAERVFRVHQNRAGSVWAVYAEGLLVYSGDTWTRHPLTDKLAAGELNMIRAGRPPSLYAVEGEKVLLAFPERLVVYRSHDQSLETLKRASGTALGRFLDLAPAENGAVWLTGENGLARSSVAARFLAPETPWAEHLVPPELGVGGLHRPFGDDDDGLTMIGELKSLDRRVLVHWNGAQWLTRSLTEENLRFAWRDSASNVFWGLTLNRLLRISGDRVETVVPPFAVSQYLDAAVQARGVFWLATREGLLRQAPSAWRVPELPGEAVGLVQGMVEDEGGGLWCAAEAGLFGQVNGFWQKYSWPTGLEVAFRPRDHLQALPGGQLVVTLSGLPWVFSQAAGRFAPLAPPAGREILQLVRSASAKGVVVLTRSREAPGGAAQLELWDGRGYVPWEDPPPLPPSSGELYFLERSRNGDWWLGTGSGPAWHHDGRWQVFSAADAYVEDGAFCWLDMGSGRVWCAGLDKVQEFDGKRWTVLCSGLDRVHALSLATDGSVWAATGDGLYRYIREAWLAVSEPEGLPGNAAHCVLEDRNRRIWAGTSRGLAYYVPRADVDPPRTQNLSWEPDPELAGGAGGRVAIEAHDKWRFTPDDRLVYSHRVDGRDWSAYRETPWVRVRDLSPGRHRLEVRTMDRNWNLEIKPASLEFRVTVAWYRDARVVGVGVFGLLLALVAAAVAANRHVQLRRSHAEVEQRVEARTRELQRATEALAHSQKMTALGTLAAGIAHDFNNILSIVKGSAQIIAANPQDRDKVLTRVSRILSMVDQASDLVKAMLGFGTASEREVKPCDVNRVVEDTVRLLSDRFRRDVTLELGLAPELPPALAAADLLRQMLLNLIFNGADAMNARGTVALSTGLLETLPADLVLPPRPARCHVFVRVVDHGSGIAPDNLPRIFEPFFTTKAMADRPGRGLGLYMVHEFAREMGCGIRVQSALNQGSAFTLIVPVAGETLA